MYIYLNCTQGGTDMFVFGEIETFLEKFLSTSSLQRNGYQATMTNNANKNIFSATICIKSCSLPTAHRNSLAAHAVHTVGHHHHAVS